MESMEKEYTVRQAAEALLSNDGNEERALWRIISELDTELWKDLREYKFASGDDELRDRIESRIQELA